MLTHLRVQHLSIPSETKILNIWQQKYFEINIWNQKRDEGFHVLTTYEIQRQPFACLNNDDVFEIEALKHSSNAKEIFGFFLIKMYFSIFRRTTNSNNT